MTGCDGIINDFGAAIDSILTSVFDADESLIYDIVTLLQNIIDAIFSCFKFRYVKIFLQVFSIF